MNFSRLPKQRLQMSFRLEVEAWNALIDVSVSAHLSSDKVQSFALDQARRSATLDDCFEEALKDLPPVTVPDPAERIVVRYTLI